VPARLKPVGDLPGVWRPEQTQQPGTYAFIAGVSAYRYLDGSAASLTLGQLAVSALTAFQVFRYFAHSYRHRTAPIAEVTLMLAPTAAEQALFDSQPDYPITQQTAPLPTLYALCEAIQSWYARLADLEPEAAKQSRLFFFFSGHGLELAPSQQLLLPHDYPGPARMYNNALTTENLHAGLGSLSIPEQLFLIDACRSDIASLHELAMTTGVPALDVKRRQVQRSAPILWASTPGAATFQPDTAEDLETSSFFGRSVLDALLLRDESFKPNCAIKPCKIEFFPLVDYANERMAQQLSSPGSAPLSAGGIVKNVTVSHVALKVKSSGANRAREDTVEARAADEAAWLQSGELVPEVAPVLVDVDVERSIAARRLFMWDGDWLPIEPTLRFVREGWRSDGQSYAMELRFERTDRWYLVLIEHQGIAHASMFPAGFDEDPLFALTLDMAKVGSIATVRAGLSGANAPELRSALALCDPSASLGTTAADGTIDSTAQLERFLDTVPFAATLASLGLLRRGEFELLRPLLPRMATPSLPMSDLAVVGLRLMALQSQWDSDALRECVASIGQLGIPASTEAAHYLHTFVSSEVAAEATAQLGAMLDDFSRVGPVMRSGGLFVTLVTHSEKMPAYIRLFA
jgi:hypothetical protein